MPARGKSKVSDAQRRKLAAGRAIGKTAKQLAKETGLAHSTVMKQVVDPRTTTLAQHYKVRYEPQITRIFEKTLNGIEADVLSLNTDLAVKSRNQALKVVTLGDPPLERLNPPSPGGGDFTLEELLVTYRKATVRLS